MRFDRILTGILTWINSLVWWRQEAVKQRPFERLKGWRLEGRGILHQIRRSDDICPRDVGTFLFEPFRDGGQTSKIRDVYICCDQLEGMIGAAGFTHRITIMLAAHWSGPDGLCDVEEFYQADHDLQGQQQRRDLYVLFILHHKVAFRLAFLNIEAIDWGWEIELAKKECMGSAYTPKVRYLMPEVPIEKPGLGIIFPYDEGTKPLRME